MDSEIIGYYRLPSASVAGRTGASARGSAGGRRGGEATPGRRTTIGTTGGDGITAAEHPERSRIVAMTVSLVETGQ